MKYKNYLLILLIAILFNSNYVYASSYVQKDILQDGDTMETVATCYYQSSDKKTRAFVNLYYDKQPSGKNIIYSQKGKINLEKLNGSSTRSTGSIENLEDAWRSAEKRRVEAIGLLSLSSIKNDYTKCPKYVTFNSSTNGALTNSLEEAQKLPSARYYAERISPEEYWGEYNTGGYLDDTEYELECEDLFGDVKDDGENYDPDKNDTPSLAYAVNFVMQYVRIIVPILVIIFGVVDMVKAVIASKEDEMTKAKNAFVKRLIAGVVIFFIPLVVNLVMKLGDYAWEGLGFETCTLEEIEK